MQTLFPHPLGVSPPKPVVARGPQTPPALLAVVLWLLVTGCTPSPDAPVDAGLVGDSGMDASTRRDGGRPGDAGKRMDSGDLLEGLFGGIEAIIPGNPCEPSDDRCRGSRRLFVCLGDGRDPEGDNAACEMCESDEECESEYPYFEDVACSAGQCRVPSGTDQCAAGQGHCRTARAGSFACVDGRCVRCIGPAECAMEYGTGWVCLSTGQCGNPALLDGGPGDAGTADASDGG